MKQRMQKRRSPTCRSSLKAIKNRLQLRHCLLLAALSCSPKSCGLQWRCELWSAPWCPAAVAGRCSPSLSGWGSQLGGQQRFVKATERKAGELVLWGRGKAPGDQSFHRSCAGGMLAAALREAALLESSFLLCSTLVGIMPLRN